MNAIDIVGRIIVIGYMAGLIIWDYRRSLVRKKLAKQLKNAEKSTSNTDNHNAAFKKGKRGAITCNAFSSIKQGFCNLARYIVPNKISRNSREDKDNPFHGRDYIMRKQPNANNTLISKKFILKI